MSVRMVVRTGIAALCLGTAANVAAQDAAESAMILSGAGAQGKAQRSLGSAISRSINSASNAISVQRTQRAAPRRSTSRNARQGGTIPAGVDPLEGLDAATYKLENGASISVSGRLNAAPAGSCVKDCSGE